MEIDQSGTPNEREQNGTDILDDTMSLDGDDVTLQSHSNNERNRATDTVFYLGKGKSLNNTLEKYQNMFLKQSSLFSL